MPNKKITISIIVALAISLIAFLVLRKDSSDPTPTPTPVISLPINTIPVTERPFVTLTPDSTGRSLELLLDNTEVNDLIEYELVYQAGTKQEGVFGRLNLASGDLPIIKNLLLGSRSAGGKTTYHEDITGGSLTLSYGEIKLKESFNFLRFDPTDPVVSSPDVRFSVEFDKTEFKADTVIVVMKTFGLYGGMQGAILAGPYAYLAPRSAEGAIVSVRLPAGEHVNPTIYEFMVRTEEWVALDTTLEDDTVTAPANSNSLFIVTGE